MNTIQFIGLIILAFIICKCDNPPIHNANETGKEQKMPGTPPFARVKSPEFNSDGTITFRIWAPKASEVILQCSELIGDQSDTMERFDKEYWQITICPARSGRFYYKFLVDGVQTPDPVNARMSGNSSIIVVEGEETDFFKVRDVPHGVIHRHFYHNSTIETVRSCHVYVPAEYHNLLNNKYPVLILFHGSGETDESWFAEGKANVILDNLIADSKSNPMILVAPYGHTVEPGTYSWPFVEEQGDFIQDFNEILVPFLKSHYRISGDPSDWALAGFSMGGYHTLKIGLNNLEQYGNLGPFSWGGGQEFLESNAPHVLEDPELINNKLSTFFLACGRNDFLFEGSEKMDSLLTDSHFLCYRWRTQHEELEEVSTSICSNHF
jgi:enterochelin esterase family protein